MNQAASSELPLLGVAGEWGDAEIELACRLDELHQLIYRKGGIRPTNAALEELSKVLLLRLWADRSPDRVVAEGVTLQALVSRPESVVELVSVTKKAFTLALRCPEFTTAVPGSEAQSLWPLDEPFRLRNEEVLIAAFQIAKLVTRGGYLAVSDPLGAAFDALLSGRYDHAGGLGTYLTPSAVARAIADIAVHFADPALLLARTGYLAADPYCGRGRFLVAAAEALHAHSGGRAHQYVKQVLGTDQAPSSVAKARINLHLYGATSVNVWTIPDSVTSPALADLAGQIPLVLTNPPFGDGKYDSEEGLRYTKTHIGRLGKRNRIDPALACMVRAASLLAPGGVLGIVLPDGVVHGAAFSDFLRDSHGLCAEGLAVVASVSLPTATFALSGTVAKTSAVFIRRGGQPKRVWLARSSHVGYLRAQGKAARDPEGSDLQQIVDLLIHPHPAVQKGDAEAVVVSEHPFVASAASEGGLGSLDPGVLDSRASLTRGTRASAGRRTTLSSNVAALKSRRVPATTGTPFLSVLHIDELGVPAWEEAETHLPTTPGFLVPTGSLLVSLLNPSKLRATVVPDCYAEVVCSAEFGVFKTNCDPYAIIGLLYLEETRAQLRPLGRGTSSSRRRITPRDVEELTVPSMSPNDLARLGMDVRGALESIRSARGQLATIFSG